MTESRPLLMLLPLEHPPTPVRDRRSGRRGGHLRDRNHPKAVMAWRKGRPGLRKPVAWFGYCGGPTAPRWVTPYAKRFVGARTARILRGTVAEVLREYPELETDATAHALDDVAARIRDRLRDRLPSRLAARVP